MQRKWVVWLWVVAGLVISGGLRAADAPQADSAKEDLKKLEGTWQVVSNERRGEAKPEGEVKGLRLVIQGDAVTMQKDGKPVGGKGKLSSCKHGPVGGGTGG